MESCTDFESPPSSPPLPSFPLSLSLPLSLPSLQPVTAQVFCTQTLRLRVRSPAAAFARNQIRYCPAWHGEVSDGRGDRHTRGRTGTAAKRIPWFHTHSEEKKIEREKSLVHNTTSERADAKWTLSWTRSPPRRSSLVRPSNPPPGTPRTPCRT